MRPVFRTITMMLPSTTTRRTVDIGRSILVPSFCSMTRRTSGGGGVTSRDGFSGVGVVLETPARNFPPAGVSFLTASDSFVVGSVSPLLVAVTADSVGGVAGFDRAGARRRELRGVDLAVVLAPVDFAASGFLVASVAGFSADSGPVATARGTDTGAGVGSGVVVVSAGGSARVAPTEDPRFVP